MIAATVIGDGEGETGPHGWSWFSNTFINPVNDGAVLPILHLNGVKFLTRQFWHVNQMKIYHNTSKDWVGNLFLLMGLNPEQFCMAAHALFAKVMDEAIEKIKAIQAEARQENQQKMLFMHHCPVLVAVFLRGGLVQKLGMANQLKVASALIKYQFRSMPTIWNMSILYRHGSIIPSRRII